MVADRMIRGSRTFATPILITNPGDPEPTERRGELYRRGRNTDPGMDEDGTLITDWMLLLPPDVVIEPWAEVQNPATGAIYWVHGLVDPNRSLLRGVVDHLEVRLKSVFRVMTTVDILRDSDGTDVNDLGDAVPTEVAPPAERTNIPASVLERTQQLPTDGDLRTVSKWVGWVPYGTDVRRNDRLRTPDGTQYRVDGVTRPVRVGLRELRLDLVRITGTP